MSNNTRALIIGLLGPALSALGLLWMLARAALETSPERADLRYFLFDSPHLVVAVGVFVSALCIPIAIRVSLASEDEVEIPAFDASLEDEEPQGARQPAPPYRWSAE